MISIYRLILFKIVILMQSKVLCGEIIAEKSQIFRILSQCYLKNDTKWIFIILSHISVQVCNTLVWPLFVRIYEMNMPNDIDLLNTNNIHLCNKVHRFFIT